MPLANAPATFVTMKNQIDKMMPKFAGNSIVAERTVNLVDAQVADVLDAVTQGIVDQTRTGVNDWLSNMRDMAAQWREAVW